MERLTPSEEQVMLRLWKLDKANVEGNCRTLPSPRPAYNTVSTIVRILERKKFIKHKAFGRGYIYMPRVSKRKAIKITCCVTAWQTTLKNNRDSLIEFVRELNLMDSFSFQQKACKAKDASQCSPMYSPSTIDGKDCF